MPPTRFRQIQNFPRDSSSSAKESIETPSTTLLPGEIAISRTTLVVILTICAVATLLSLLGIAALTYREHARHRQNQSAKVWGRLPNREATVSTKKGANASIVDHFNHQPKRITLMRKAVDDEFSAKFGGCYTHSIIENPYLLAAEPVELMLEERVWEVPALPPTDNKSTHAKGSAQQQRKSFWFDTSNGFWVQKK